MKEIKSELGEIWHKRLLCDKDPETIESKMVTRTMIILMCWLTIDIGKTTFLS